MGAAGRKRDDDVVPPMTVAQSLGHPRARWSEAEGSAVQIDATGVSCPTASSIARRFLVGPCREAGWSVSSDDRTGVVRFTRGRKVVKFRPADGGRCTARDYPTYKHPPTYLPSTCANRRQRPSTVVFACGDGNAYLARLRWRRWGFDEATAIGIARINDCSPYCAAGPSGPWRRARLPPAYRVAVVTSNTAVLEVRPHGVECRAR
jgi:hypothetical protein